MGSRGTCAPAFQSSNRWGQPRRSMASVGALFRPPRHARAQFYPEWRSAGRRTRHPRTCAAQRARPPRGHKGSGGMAHPCREPLPHHRQRRCTTARLAIPARSGEGISGLRFTRCQSNAQQSPGESEWSSSQAGIPLKTLTQKRSWEKRAALSGAFGWQSQAEGGKEGAPVARRGPSLRGPDGRIRQAFHWVVSGPALRRPSRRTPRIAGPGHRRSGACCRRRTVVVGPQHVRAPSRVAPGRAALRVQLQEVPFAPSSDAAGEPDVSAPWPAHRRANGPAVIPRPGTVRPVGGKAPGPPRRATPGTGRADATVRCR